MIRAVTFDLGGTIWCDEDEAVRDQIRASGIDSILKGKGRSPGVESILRALEACGERSQEVRKEGHRDFPPEDQVPFILEELGMPITRDLVEAILEPYTGAILQSPPSIIPGASRALEAVAERCKVGLISNTGVSPGVSIRKVLEAQGLKRHFTSLTFSNEVGFVKPHSLIFENTLRDLAVEPGEAIHIGDDAYADVGGAKKMGMKAVLYGTIDPMADGSLLSYEDLLEVLKGLGLS